MNENLKVSSLILLSYIASHIIYSIDNVAFYYLCAMCMNLCFAISCANSDYKPTLVYGVLNAAHVFFLFPFLFDDYTIAIYMLYESSFSLKNIMISYEITLLAYGGYLGLRTIVDRHMSNILGFMANYTHH